MGHSVLPGVILWWESVGDLSDESVVSQVSAVEGDVGVQSCWFLVNSCGLASGVNLLEVEGGSHSMRLMPRTHGSGISTC